VTSAITKNSDKNRLVKIKGANVTIKHSSFECELVCISYGHVKDIWDIYCTYETAGCLKYAK